MWESVQARVPSSGIPFSRPTSLTPRPVALRCDSWTIGQVPETLKGANHHGRPSLPPSTIRVHVTRGIQSSTMSHCFNAPRRHPALQSRKRAGPLNLRAAQSSSAHLLTTEIVSSVPLSKNSAPRPHAAPQKSRGRPQAPREAPSPTGGGVSLQQSPSSRYPLPRYMPPKPRHAVLH